MLVMACFDIAGRVMVGVVERGNANFFGALRSPYRNFQFSVHIYNYLAFHLTKM